MNLPQRNRHWLKESLKALNAAEKRAIKEEGEIEFLYKYAVEYIIKNRGITDSEIIEEMKEFIQAQIDQDWGCDPESKKQYKFHFVSSYIYGHVPAELIEEMPADRIMEYVNESTNLFIE